MRKRIGFIVLGLVLLSGSAYAAPERITLDLAERLESLASTQSLPVIVVLRDGFVSGGSFLADQLAVLDLTGASAVKHLYENIPAVALSLGRSQILSLAYFDRIDHIEFDAPVQAYMDTAASHSGTRAAQTQYGLSGKGVTVAVIDTGIDAQHAAFNTAAGCKVVAFKDFVNNKTAAYDDHGHGSHCAGIIAGEGHDGGLDRGVAPGASLVGVKVLNAQGSGSTSNIVAGIDWCIEYNKDKTEADDIDVISLSLGSTGSSDGTDANSLAVNRAVENGIVAVVAAGNSGPKAQTIGSPGAADDAITVGAMTDPGEGGFNLAYFSSRGPAADGDTKPDICAPGVNINAPEANSGSGYVKMSGTSMATPFVAGVAALMLEANAKADPGDAVDAYEVKDILTRTAEDWGKTGQDNEYGFGRIDGFAAIKAAGGFNYGDAPAKPGHQAFSGSLAAGGWWIFSSSKSATHQVRVTDPSRPLSLTLIINEWSGLSLFNARNFDLYLKDASGKTVASSTGSTRQETISVTAPAAGDYTIEVRAVRGSSSYNLDVSGGI